MSGGRKGGAAKVVVAAGGSSQVERGGLPVRRGCSGSRSSWGLLSLERDDVGMTGSDGRM